MINSISRGGLNQLLMSKAEEAGAVIEFVPEVKQRQAIQFLQEQLFTTPTWLIDKKMYSLTGNGDYSAVNKVQAGILVQLLSIDRLSKLDQQQLFDPANAYTPAEMLKDLYKGIFSELPAHKAIDIYRRNLQKTYVEDIIRLVGGGGSSGGGRGMITISAGPASTADKTSDAISVIKAHIKTVAAEIKASIPVAPDAATRMHLQDIYERLDATVYKKD